MDNATYHKTQSIQKFFRSVGVKLMYTAPYSYRASPIERFFAVVKSHIFDIISQPRDTD